MNRCEDYPCCGHGPPPLGDGGGCPDEDGCFDCVLCGAKLPRRARSAICDGCRTRGTCPECHYEWLDCLC